MEKSSNSAVAVFAEAIALPPGAARDQLVAERCGEDTGLLRDLASLLQAHDDAGSFLKLSVSRAAGQLGATSAASQGTAVMNAAVQADVFLRRFGRVRLPDPRTVLARGRKLDGPFFPRIPH